MIDIYLDLRLYHCAALLLAVFLDLVFGDPKRLHIIILIGKLISALENRLRKTSANNLRAGGRILVLTALLTVLLPAAVILHGAYYLSPYFGAAVESLLLWQLIAGRELCRQSMAVYYKLKAGELDGARRALSMIVGRDTQALDASGVSKAAVESVAENTSDGVIAPLFYIMLLGPLGGLAYKTINTMDSMLGYKSERYIDFGRAAAKTDDAANLIPSRLSALLMLAAAFLLGYDARGAWRVFRRDRKNHESPNSGQTESVCAGALNIRLGGPAVYGGKLTERKYIGDDLRAVEAGDISRANKLMLLSSAFMLIIALAFRCAIY